jgi:hypothetical protein
MVGVAFRLYFSHVLLVCFTGNEAELLPILRLWKSASTCPLLSFVLALAFVRP